MEDDAAGLSCATTGHTEQPVDGGGERLAEIYVSTDVESDGPIPGPHSMLSFASAAYRADKTPVGTFAANLATLPGAAGDPKTMAWWEGEPAAWAACRANPREPAAVM